METAYSELYLEFLRLRSLCLKQAELLQQLTSALNTQTGGCAPEGGALDGGPGRGGALDGSPGRGAPVPVQSPQERPGAGGTQAGSHALHGGPALGGPGGPAGAFSELLAGDMFMLKLDAASPDRGLGGRAPSDPPSERGWHEPQPASHHPRVCGSHLDSAFLSHGGLMMSELALQSQVCEFCNAVFPGHTHTRGEFLRHLHTHVS